MTVEQMPDLDPLCCLECARLVKDPLSAAADGWVPVRRSVDEDDDYDGFGWKCPDCATPSDKWAAEQFLRQAGPPT